MKNVPVGGLWKDKLFVHDIGRIAHWIHTVQAPKTLGTDPRNPGTYLLELLNRVRAPVESKDDDRRGMRDDLPVAIAYDR